jgi:hypothetical protein
MPFPALVVEFDIGALSKDMTGKRYDNVFPVPVGDMAAKSRDFGHQRYARPKTIEPLTSNSIGHPADWIPVGCS